MITGNQLRLLRTLKNIDQAGLARMLGKSQQYISRIEGLGDNKIPLYWFNKIVTELDCSEAELVSIRNITPPAKY